MSFKPGWPPHPAPGKKILESAGHGYDKCPVCDRYKYTADYPGKCWRCLRDR